MNDFLDREGEPGPNKKTVIIRKNTELDDAQVEAASLEDLRKAYRWLRDHHIQETSALWEQIRAYKEANEL